MRMKFIFGHRAQPGEIANMFQHIAERLLMRRENNPALNARIELQIDLCFARQFDQHIAQRNGIGDGNADQLVAARNGGGRRRHVVIVLRDRRDLRCLRSAYCSRWRRAV